MTSIAELGEDLAALVRAQGAPLVAATPLSRRGPQRIATAFRLEFADGMTLKGARLADADTAARVAGLIDEVGALAPRLIARGGAAMLTEWVEGTSLADVEWSDALLQRCGAAQARVHARACFDADPRQMAADRADVLRRGLDILAGTGMITDAERDGLARIARQHAPGSCMPAVSLIDYCAENIVCRADGEPCLIDIETLDIAPAEHDLGRTWYRWPMRPEQRAAYLDGYRAHADPDSFLAHLPFWHMTALVRGAVYRHAQQHEDVTAPIGALRLLLDTAQR